MDGQFIERQSPLSQCPEAFCRRSHLCRNEAALLPCLRTHQSLDDFRYALAEKLRRLAIEAGADPASLGQDRPLTYQEERKLAAFKQALWQADHDYTVREMAEKAARQQGGPRR